MERAVGCRAREPVQGCAEVVVVALELVEKRRRPRTAHQALDRPRQVEVVLRVAAPEHVELTALLEPHERELADRLQQDVAPAVPAQQALVDQRRDRVETRLADVLGRVERAPAREDPQPGERASLRRLEQVVAPGDRRAQRPLPLRRVARAAGQQRQAPFQAARKVLRREGLQTRRRVPPRDRQRAGARRPQRPARVAPA